jgi:nucleoside-diphosphate-sugar epimerase
MKILFIGGTGIISTACTALAVEQGMDVVHLNRGQRTDVVVPPEVECITGDIHDPESVARALGDRTFDVVVDWIAFNTPDVERDIKLFRDRTAQYIFISSASAYETPPSHYIITEETPLLNPYWEYSRNKIACEELLMAAHKGDGFPATIVRPSHTYGETQIPVPMGSWVHPYTIIDRMRRGEPIIIPGDGTSLWTLTHNTDFAKGFVGLLGNPAAIGEDFHITSDEALPWNQICQDVANAAGVSLNAVHIPSDFIAASGPGAADHLLGDMTHSVVFDNSKLKSLVPGYQATLPFAEGIRESLAWYDADPGRQTLDKEADTEWSRIIAAYEKGLAALKQ